MAPQRTKEQNTHGWEQVVQWLNLGTFDSVQTRHSRVCTMYVFRKVETDECYLHVWPHALAHVYHSYHIHALGHPISKEVC